MRKEHLCKSSIKGRWVSQGEQQNFTLAMNNLFRYSKVPSAKSIASQKRELSKETLIKRTIPQIIEMEEKGLPWDTPESWDYSFYLLKKGSRYRTSKVILSRMDWSYFLDEVKMILQI